MFRCVIYTSTANDPWAEEAVLALQHRSDIKNAEAGITGRLMYQAGRFVQAIEGADGDVGRLFAVIAADPRHGNIAVLFDGPIAHRSHAAGGLAGSVSDAGPQDPPPIAPDATDLDDDGFAAWLRSGGAGNAVRIAPTQGRGRTTINRLLGGVRHLLARDGSTRGVNVETVAEAAGVTRQAAYRYFASPSDLLRAFVRHRAMENVQAFRARFAQAALTDDVQTAAFVARVLVDRFMTRPPVPMAVASYLLRHYHEEAVDLTWSFVPEVLAAMQRGGVPEADLPPYTNIACGLSAAGTIAKMIALNDPALLGTDRMRSMMAGAFLGALRGPPAP